jgi:hypothetical protein
VWSAASSVPFLTSWGLLYLGFLGHLLLDAVSHTNGIKLFWPLLSWRVRWGLTIGLNPTVSSAKCYRRSTIQCLVCQTHCALRSPVFALTAAGVLLSLAIPGQAVPLARIALLILGCLFLACLVLKRRAAALFVSDQGESSPTLLGCFPAAFSPLRWLAIARLESGGYRLGLVDLRRQQVSELRELAPPATDLPEGTGPDAPEVANFLENAILPYVASLELPGGEAVVKWIDLAYAIDPGTDLFALRLKLDSEGSLIDSAFLERWPTADPAWMP